MADKNIEKPDPSIGQSGKDAVDKVDKNAPLSLKEAEAVIEAEEGQIEETIEKSKTEKSESETRIAPDLIELKKEQTEKKKDLVKEVKEKKKEVKEATKVEKEVVAPSKFENKTPEERLEIYKEMESSYTKKSQRVAELEAKVAELDTVNKKIEELEKESVIRQQKTQIKLPEYPADELYYDDPVKYNRKVKEYNDAQLNARLAPLYGSNWTSQKDKLISDLKESTKDDVVPFTEIEKEIKSRVNKNPAIVNQLGLGASQYFYNQIRNEQLPQKMEEYKTKAKEEAKRELEEESKEITEDQMMSSDITTQKRESQEVDFEKQLDDEDNPEKIIQGIKKKYGITRDI